MFSTLCGTYFLFQMPFKVSSAVGFNLDQSKVLSSGNGLNKSRVSTTYIRDDCKILYYLFHIEASHEKKNEGILYS